MPEPIPPTQINPEIPIPQQVVVGETPLYLKTPIKVGDVEVSSVIIQSSDKRSPAGVESSVLLVKEASRKKGEEGQIIDKPVIHIDAMDQMAWDKISGIQWTDEAGVAHVIQKEELSLEKTSVVSPQSSEKVSDLGDVSTLSDLGEKPKIEARKVLETLTEDPNTITIIGLRAYETRALDLADRSMQRLGTPLREERADATKNLWEKTKDSVHGIHEFVFTSLWKQSIGGIYFHERARQYYLDMIKASETPFAEQSIRLAEARATEMYNKKLADSNFIVRAGSKTIDWLKDKIGMRSAIQNMALTEIGVMKNSGELAGAEVFERETKAVRARFGQDMDKADQFIRTQLGEKLEILDPSKEEHKPLVEGIQGLLKQYASGEIPNRAEFDKRTKEFFNATLKNVRPDIFAEAELYSSSLFDAAEMLRNKMSHEGGLANIDEAMAGMHIRLGLGSMGEVTSLEPTAVERGIGRVREIYEWLNKKNIIVPMVFNEVAIGSGIAIALSATNFVKTMPIRIAAALPKVAVFLGPLASAAPFTAGVLAGGAFAGWKEYGQLQKDYLTHLRERESGTQFTDTMKRRAWFEKFSVKQRSANEMITTIQTAMDTGDYRTAMATIADLQARKAVSETGPKRIGLVQYSGREGIESERAALDIVASKSLSDLSNLGDLSDLLGGNTFPEFMEKLTVMQTRVLKQGIGVMDNFDDPVKATLGLVSQYAPEAAMIKRRWSMIGSTETKALGMDAILSEFNSEARMEAIKYGVKAGVIGAGVGAAIQGVEALFHSSAVADAAHSVTQHAKDVVADRTQPAVFTPGGTHTETVALSAPQADHIVHIGNQDYQLPNEISIVSHTSRIMDGHAVGPDDGVTTYDAAFHVNGPVQDVTLGNNMTPQQLTDELHKVGLNLIDAHKAGIPSSYTYDSPTIPHLPAPTGVDRLSINLPPDYSVHYVPDHHNWQIIDDNKNVITTVKFDNTGDFQGTPTELAKITDDLHKYGLDWKSTNAHVTIPGTQPAPVAVPESVTPPPEILTLNNNMPITGAELSAKGGVWNYFLEKTHGENPMSTTNGMKNLFRLYTHEDQLASIPDNAQFTVPEKVFGEHGIAEFSKLNNQAILDYQHTLTDPSVKDPLEAIQHMYEAGGNQKMEAIVLKLGYVGQDSQLPNAEDVTALMSHLSGTATHAAAPVAVGSGIPIPITPEVPPHTVDYHQISITPSYPTAEAAHIGPIIGNTITLPYSLPSEVDLASTLAHEQLRATSDDYGLRHMTENLAAAKANTASELPWFPIILPVRSALEAAPMEMGEANEIKPSETFYFPMGNETAFISKESMDARKSPRLIENPQATLSQSEEVAWYLSQLPAEDTDTLAALVAQHDTPITPDVRTVITLPTSSAAHNITERLTQYTTQTAKDGTPLDPKKMELVIYDINPAAEGMIKADVDKFIADHPDMQVTYLSHTYEGDLKSGRIKRDLSNYVLSRLGTLPADHPDVLFLTDNTVPGMTMQPTYVAGLIDAADANPNADILHGTNMLPNEAFAQYPMLFASHRAFELFDAFVRNGEAGNIPNVYSGNMAVRAGSLAALGGYNADSPGAEDRELSWMMRSARGTGDVIQSVPDMQTIIDPKETVYSQYLQPLGLAENVPLETNDTYKDMSWSDMAKRASEGYTKEQLESNLSNMYTTVYPSLKAANPARFDGYFKRTMDALGLQYEIKDDKVVITDMASLSANMAAEIDTETFAKNTAAEVIAETPTTPRESLESLAGESEPVPAEPPAEPLASSVSSPDVSHLSDLGNVSNLENQTQKTEQLPEGIEDRVNYVLSKTKESTAAVGITTGELMDYLKTRLELAGNTRITDGNIRIDGSNVTLNDMKAKSLVGEATFSSKMVTDPQKGLTVDMQSTQYHLPLLMKLFEGKIKHDLNHFDDALLTHMSQRIPANWKAERIDVVGTKIEVKFAKK